MRSLKHIISGLTKPDFMHKSDEGDCEDHLDGQEEEGNEDCVPADREEKPLWQDCKLDMEPLRKITL